MCSIERNFWKFCDFIGIPETALGQGSTNSLTMKALCSEPHLLLIWSGSLYKMRQGSKSREAGWRMIEKKHHHPPREHQNEHQHTRQKYSQENTITNVRKLRIWKLEKKSKEHRKYESEENLHSGEASPNAGRGWEEAKVPGTRCQRFLLVG